MDIDPKFPPNFKDTIEDTRFLVNKLIERAALIAGVAGKKWIDGFEESDAKSVAEDIGAKLKDQVVDAWQIAQKNVTPPEDGRT